MNFNKVTFEKSFGKSTQLDTSTVPEIVFSGRSNVGKSSLINKILNRKSIARISSNPGKTSTINFFKVDNIRFADLPGYGYAKVSDSEKLRWKSLIEDYFLTNRNISLVIQIIDIRHDLTKDDLTMINFLKENNFNFLVVLTKVDKLNKTNRNEMTTFFKEKFDKLGIDFIISSSKIGEGIDLIREIISKSSKPKEPC